MKILLSIIFCVTPAGIYSMQLNQNPLEKLAITRADKTTESSSLSEVSIKKNVWVNYGTFPEKKCFPLCFDAGPKEEFFIASTDLPVNDFYIVMTCIRGMYYTSTANDNEIGYLALLTFFTTNPFRDTSFTRCSTTGPLESKISICSVLKKRLASKLLQGLPANKKAPLKFTTILNDPLKCYQALVLSKESEKQNLLTLQGLKLLADLVSSEVYEAYKQLKIACGVK